MYEHHFHINETLKEVSSAILRAESDMKRHIKCYYHDADEEFITKVLYGQIRYHFQQSSEKKLIESAFIRDLKNAIQQAFPFAWDLGSQIHSEAAGLVADIVLHNKRQEGRTGGDFGLIVIHPKIQSDYEGLAIKKGRISGLLCQAKLKHRDGAWGRLTKTQAIVLSKRMDYTSLGLYSYSDQNRTDLNSIEWALCKNSSIRRINASLKSHSFEKFKILHTGDMIKSLAKEEIGTTKQTIIDEIISPSKRHCLEVKIHWRSDTNPKGEVSVRVRDQQRERQHVYEFERER